MSELKVAIVGAAPSSQMLAPFDDYSWDVWVLGNQLSAYDGKRIDVAFEIHDDLSEQPDGYPEWLVKYAPRVIVGDKFPIKGHEVYPYKEVAEFLGGDYLSSSIAYMFAYALYKGATEIAIYGVDMAVDDHEYFRQRPDLYAWIGYAKGRGIKVTIPDESGIFKSTYNEGRDWGSGNSDGTPPFSVHDFTEMAEKHRQYHQKLRAEINELELKLAAHRGAEETYVQLARVARGVSGGARIASLAEVTNVGGS